MTTTYGFLFPGQGSQRVGMGKDLCSRWPVARETFEEANEALGFDLMKLCFSGNQHELTATENAQVAILTTSVATAHILRTMGIVPAMAVGHSVGSFAALVVAHVLPFASAVRLIRQRGLLMGAVSQPGTMLALVAAHPEQLGEMERIGQEEFDLDVAGCNSPTQTVFSGSVERIERFQAYLAPLSGVQAKGLAVSQAFHSRLMAEKQEEWRAYLEQWPLSDAQIPVGLNVSGTFTTDREQIVTDLIEQFTHAVQWRSLYAQMLDSCEALFEVGLGHTLSGLARAWKGHPTPMTTENASALQRVAKKFPPTEDAAPDTLVSLS